MPQEADVNLQLQIASLLTHWHTANHSLLWIPYNSTQRRLNSSLQNSNDTERKLYNEYTPAIGKLAGAQSVSRDPVCNLKGVEWLVASLYAIAAD
eukprot:13680-Heterococcus_DN1.PRE.2